MPATMTPSRNAAETEFEPSWRRFALHLAVLIVLGVALGAVLGGPAAARSAAIGVLLGAVNLLAMRRITHGLTRADGGSAVWALALPVKLLTLVGSAYALVVSGLALPFPLALGFAALPLSSVFLPRPSSVRGAMVGPTASSPVTSVLREPLESSRRA
jgi:hypothetical protein